MADDEDEFTELYDAAIPRVDLVGKGANGLPFLIAKSQGVMPPEFVRDLISKSTPTETPETQEHMVTVSGSPAAIAEMIAKAPVRKTDNDAVLKAKLSAADMNDKPDSDFAYIEPGGKKDASGKTVPRSKRHFYIGDADHVRDALGRASQSPFGDKAMPKIKAAAKKFKIDVAKAAAELSEAEGAALMEMFAKAADLDDAGLEVDDLIGDASAGGTAETVPGSPDWERLDADTATAAIGVLARVKACLEWLSDREATEAVTADPDDAQSAMDLADAACQVDCLICCLAAFAAGEAIEAGLADELESVGKAVATVQPVLADLEPLAAVAKAGRVLSAQNEGRVKQAAGLLQEVLGSLPAPVNDDGTPVAKSEEDNMTDEVKAAQDDAATITKSITELAAGETAETVAAGLAEVAKAKGDPQVAVYTADGKLVGVVDQSDISPIAAPAAPEGGDAQGGDEKSEDASPAEDAAPAEPADDSAPSDDGDTIPGTDTVQAPAEPDTASDDEDMAKSTSTEELVKAAVAESTAELTAELRLLKEQLQAFGQLPAPGGPRLNGATGTPGLAARDAAGTDEVEALRKAAEAETDPKKREELSYSAAVLAIRKAQTGHGPYVGQAPVNAAEVLARFTR